MDQPDLALAVRTASVTGSTGGIGRAIAAGLGAAGTRLPVNSRDAAAAREAADAIGGGTVGLEADLG
jgi:3-oxoacyl-[acyl-carrier protein] reductase